MNYSDSFNKDFTRDYLKLTKWDETLLGTIAWQINQIYHILLVYVRYRVAFMGTIYIYILSTVVFILKDIFVTLFSKRSTNN